MKIIENFVRPVTVEQLNGELSGIGAQLIDIVQAGPESLMLYFDHIDGAADCLRLSAQRGPQGADVFCAPHKGEHDTCDTAVGGDAQVLQVFIGQGRGGNLHARHRDALPALEQAAPQYGAVESSVHSVHPQKQLAVVQQQLLPRGYGDQKAGRAGNAARTQKHLLPPGERQRGRQPPDAQLRAL